LLSSSKILVIILTAFAATGGETSIASRRGLTLETEDYIDKPISPEELLARVEKLLKKVGF